ncbi:hypothetical protein VTH06DRAFT_6376 [Thermothelomyces fergusii]
MDGPEKWLYLRISSNQRSGSCGSALFSSGYDGQKNQADNRFKVHPSKTNRRETKQTPSGNRIMPVIHTYMSRNSSISPNK